MDPITIGAVLLAVASGAGEGLGNQLWDGVVGLVRHPFYRKPATGGEAATTELAPAGGAELAAFQQAPADRDKAIALARALLARSGADAEFQQALKSWWQQAEPIRESIGSVTSTITGGTQQGPVLMGRDFSNVTFGAAAATPPVPPSLRSRRAVIADPSGEETRSTIRGGTQHGPVLMGRDFRDVHIGDIVQSAAAPMALAQLPARAARFTGRDTELAQITALLDPAGDAAAVVVSAVAGLAGVGKTALAVQAGHVACQAGWFPGGVLFVDLHGYDATPVQPGQALDALLRGVGIAAEHIPPSTEERAALYRSALAQITDAVLIIADNASAEAQVRPLLPGPGPHRVVVTSRHTMAGLTARLLDVTVLDDRVAVALLDAALREARPGDDRIGADRAGAARLAGICGGLPLALQITAALLKADPTRVVSDLADDLGDEMRRLEALRYDDGSGTSAPSVAAAFELSYRQLNDITARVFRMLPVNPGPEVSTAAVATLADLPVSKARAEISHLVRAHLVEAAAGAEGRWRMHDLLRLYATQISDQDLDHDGRELARDRLLTYYVDMSHAADGHLRARPGTEVSDIFKGPTDALTWLDVERPNLVAAINVASRTGRHTVALRLPLNLTEYFIWRRRLDDLIAAVTVSIEAARHLGDRGNEAKARDIFGGALRTIGSFEKAMTAHGDAVAIFQEIGDRHGEAVALNSLGDTLWASRENIKAGAAFADAALIFREIGDLEAEGLALGNLCMVIGEDSYYDEAITQEQDMAAIFRKAGERYSEGRAFRRIGELLWMAWRFTEAIVAFRNAADIFEEIGERYDKGVMLYRTGQALERTNRDEEAIIVYRDAAATFEEIDKRYNKGMTLYRTGQALERTNRHVEAITVYRDAAATFEEIDERCNKAIALECLGDVLYKKKRFTEAIVAHREAAVIFQEAGEQSLERKVLAKVRRNERALKDPPKGDDKAKAKKAKSAGGA